MEEINALLCINPIDGRYRSQTESISSYFSEFSYIKNRVIVEIDWLLFLINKNLFDEIISDESIQKIKQIKENFNLEECSKVKEIEEVTKHDVKAIEYYVRQKLEECGLGNICYMVHFGCTSEDINNLAYGKMMSSYLKDEYIERVSNLIKVLSDMAEENKSVAMLAHTHGQPASPTTVGKELAVFAYRLNRVLNDIRRIILTGKFSGATGNFSCHKVAFPEVDWIEFAKEFVEALGLEFNYLTTQIESHDTICKLFGLIKQVNNIVYDLDQDMWLYISKKYFTQKSVDKEVGSSVMPHKINPINFENSMANTKLSNAIFECLISNIEISKMQRDLSDSSLLRNIGVGFAYNIVAITQVVKGLSRVSVNKTLLEEELNNNPEVLAEAIQTVLRKNKYNDAYEKLKELTRGKDVSIESIREFISSLDINEEDKEVLSNLNPKDYIGYAENLCEFTDKQ